MDRVNVGDLKDHIGTEVLVKAWVDIRRDHGKLIFVDLRDNSGLVQAVVTPKQEEAHKLADTVRPEWVVAVTGDVKERPDNMKKEGLNGELELSITKIEVLSEAHELPFELGSKEVNLDTYLDYLPFALRSERGRAIFKVQSIIVQAYREFLDKEGFTEFQAPKLIGGDAEGGASVFTLPYFGDHYASLAQSPQLYKQIMVGVFEGVYTTGNVFRAEKHATSRHINEYTSIDAELGFIKDHRDVTELETRLMHYIYVALEERAKREFEILGAELPMLPKEIPHMKMREAQEIVAKRLGREVSADDDLSPEEEREICAYAAEELDSDFVFVTHYPVAKRPFYIYEDEEDPGYTKSFDLLFRGVEITTGGQRVHDYDTLVKKIEGKGLKPDDFSFYLQAFKYGMPPHGGWGMGLERLTQKFLGLDNVKEATLFPRDINRIDKRLSE